MVNTRGTGTSIVASKRNLFALGAILLAASACKNETPKAGSLRNEPESATVATRNAAPPPKEMLFTSATNTLLSAGMPFSVTFNARAPFSQFGLTLRKLGSNGINVLCDMSITEAKLLQNGQTSTLRALDRHSPRGIWEKDSLQAAGRLIAAGPMALELTLAPDAESDTDECVIDVLAMNLEGMEQIFSTTQNVPLSVAAPFQTQVNLPRAARYLRLTTRRLAGVTNVLCDLSPIDVRFNGQRLSLVARRGPIGSIWEARRSTPIPPGEQNALSIGFVDQGMNGPNATTECVVDVDAQYVP